MIEWLVETLRGRQSDWIKARKYVAEAANSSFKEIMQGYDAFVPDMNEVSEPSILIGTAKDSFGREVPLRKSMEEIHCHALIQGSTNSGKTSFVTWLLSRALELGDPVGVVDCKSGFFDAAIRWAGALAYRMGRERHETFIRSLAVVNPFAEELVPLNVCRPITGITPEVQAYNVCLALSSLFNSDLSFQMDNILKHLILLLMEADLTLVEAPELMQDDLLRDLLVQRSQNAAVKNYFLRTYPSVPQSSKASLLTRIQSLLLPEKLRLMLGADGLIDFTEILDRGHPLFIFLGKGPDVPEEQVNIIGSLILQLLFQGAFNTRPNRRRPYQIILDEFFHLLDAPALEKRFESALVTLRVYGINLSLVMHYFSQVNSAMRDSILSSCDLMAIFRSDSRNSQFFGEFLPELDPEIVKQSLRKTGRLPARHEVRAQLIERLQRLPQRHCYWYDKGKPYRSLLLRVPDLSTPHKTAGISETALEDFINSRGILLGGYALPKEELRRQIERREKRLREITRLPPVHLHAVPESNASTSVNVESGENPSIKRKKPKIG